MIKEQDLESLAKVFCDDGEAFDAGGDSAQLDQLIQRGLELANGNKDVIAVEHWCWWDIDLLNKYQIPDGFLPALIKADNILFSNTPRFSPGDWVRTSMLVEFHEGVFFETRSTIYILIDKGTRKSVTPEQYQAFF
jgi:hypothetical protein